MTLKSLYQHFYSHPEGLWIMRWENVQQLYQFVKEHEVKKVLDLGTGIGCSAAVVAMALEEKGTEFYIDSVEQFDKCVKLANELIPEELKKNITIHKVNTLVWQTEKIRYQYFSIYDSDFKPFDYDLIINDGPGPWQEGDNYIDLPNGTISKLLLEGKLKPGTFIAWDGRIVALKLLERYFGNNFYIYPGSGDFNVVERKNNPIQCEDERLKISKEIGYFDEKVRNKPAATM